MSGDFTNYTSRSPRATSTRFSPRLCFGRTFCPQALRTALATNAFLLPPWAHQHKRGLGLGLGLGARAGLGIAALDFTSKTEETEKVSLGA